jgi:Domain of unknown function (DUF4404)
MNAEQLRRALRELHEELQRAPQLDDAARALLDELVADARRIGKPSAAPAQAHRLEALAVGFEADHPTLAAALRQLIDLLAKAGV